MIRIDVEDYCHGCLDFTPDVIKPHKEQRPDTGETYLTDTIVQCEYRKRCAGIKRYLEQHSKSEPEAVG